MKKLLVVALVLFTSSVAPEVCAARQGRRRASQRALAKGVRQLNAAQLQKLVTHPRHKLLLVNFWATWCEPCRDEFPDLVRINSSYAARGLDFVTVSLDELAEINRSVPVFLKEMRAHTIPAYILNEAEHEAALTGIDQAWQGQLPATYLFNSRGQVVFKHLGRIKPAELRAAIEKAISGK